MAGVGVEIDQTCCSEVTQRYLDLFGATVGVGAQSCEVIGGDSNGSPHCLSPGRP